MQTTTTMSKAVAGSRSPSPARPGGTDICICTYHRASVVETLASVAALDGIGGREIRVLVADNAEQPEAARRVADTAAALGLDCLYIHAPAGNISLARNACLDAADGDWIAFLDDDETACPGWLDALLTEADAGGWDAIFGPVEADYQPSAPDWLRRGDFHSTRPVLVRGAIRTGYCGNVLIRRAFLERHALRFDLDQGRSGGEDTDFFHRLYGLGGRMGFAPGAVVREPVQAPRARLDWLLRRAFRSGQTHGGHLARGRRAPVVLGAGLLALAKAGCCLVGALTALPAPAGRNRLLLRGALHCGVVARLAGMAQLQLYGAAPPRKPEAAAGV